jgi:hypothetical protein
MATAQVLAARGLDFTLLHQTGTTDLARVEARYARVACWKKRSGQSLGRTLRAGLFEAQLHD